MDFYIISPSIYRFINEDTDETIASIVDVTVDKRDYYYFGGKQRPYVIYEVDFLGMPPDLFPLPCQNVRLEIIREGLDQDNESYTRTLHIGEIDELHLSSTVCEGEASTVHKLFIKCYTDTVHEKEKNKKQ